MSVGIAARVAKALWKAHFLPFLPHLNAVWEMCSGHLDDRGEEGWLDYDFQWLEACEAIVRIPGHSPGADREIIHAGKCGIPVIPHDTASACTSAGQARILVAYHKYDQFLK